jgi:hypothetical protein
VSPRPFPLSSAGSFDIREKLSQLRPPNAIQNGLDRFVEFAVSWLEFAPLCLNVGPAIDPKPVQPKRHRGCARFTKAMSPVSGSRNHEF